MRREALCFRVVRSSVCAYVRRHYPTGLQSTSSYCLHLKLYWTFVNIYSHNWHVAYIKDCHCYAVDRLDLDAGVVKSRYADERHCPVDVVNCKNKQVSAVANWPARQNRAVHRAWRSPAINYSGRASELGVFITLWASTFLELSR